MRGNMTDAGRHLSNELEGTICRVNKLNCHFELGDIAWVNIQDCSWWPAQVVDEKNVWCKPKKKEENEVLVRLYGTYEYLYVDPIRSASGLEIFLKQGNGNIREAFQKTLEEDISRVKSAGNTKRKCQKIRKAKEKPLAEASESKKQNQDHIVIDLEADDSDSGNRNQTNAPRSKALGKKRRNQAGVRIPKLRERARDGAAENRIGKLEEERVAKNARPVTCNEKSDKQKESKVIKMARGTASEKKGGQSKEPKLSNVRDQTSKGKSGKLKEPEVNKGLRKGKRDETMDTSLEKKKRKQDGIFDDRSAKKMKQAEALKDKNESSAGESVKRGEKGKTNAMEGLNESLRVKNMKRLTRSKVKAIEEHVKTETPVSPKHGTPEGASNLSGRRVRVMQSLGLVAPLGSPFSKC